MSGPATATIQAARPGDAPALAEVFVAAWRAGYRGVVADEIIDGLDRSELTAWFAGQLSDSTMPTVVALDAGGTVVGFARFGSDPERPDDAGRGYLAALYVDPIVSGRGIGRRLVGHVMETLAHEGRDDVTLWVFAANERARRLYEQAGFIPDGAETVDPRWGAIQVRYRRQEG
jgi:ribosomal protein S18 acetylase RimI-like enzyme